MLVKRVKVNFPTNHILNSNLIIKPLCEPWEVILFVEIHLVQCRFFLDIGAYTGCLTNVFIIEWKMNLSLKELNPTWTAATGLVDSSNKNTEMNAIYSAGIQKKIWSSSPVIINFSSLNVCNSPVAHRYAICLSSLDVEI